jgi:hypothetical protein
VHGRAEERAHGRGYRDKWNRDGHRFHLRLTDEYFNPNRATILTPQLAEAVMTKRERPSARCARCNKTYDVPELGAKCRLRIGKNMQCGGLIVAAENEDDWWECPACFANGYEDNGQQPCQQCDGYGWICVRDMPATVKEQILRQRAGK